MKSNLKVFCLFLTLVFTALVHQGCKKAVEQPSNNEDKTLDSGIKTEGEDELSDDSLIKYVSKVGPLHNFALDGVYDSLQHLFIVKTRTKA